MAVEASGAQVGIIAPPATVPAGLRGSQFAVSRAIDPFVSLHAITYRANMRATLRRANAVGDVIVVVPNRIHPHMVSPDVQKGYAQVLADAGALLVSLPQILEEYDAAQVAGYCFDDAHRTGLGYEKIAATLGNMLLV